MKKFLSLLLLIFFVVGCSKIEVVTPDDSSVSEPEVAEPAEKVEVVTPDDSNVSEPEVTKPAEIEAKDIVEFTDYVTNSNSTLTDNSGVGFAYEDSMALDNDFSTAWCSSTGGTDAEISFEFPEIVKAEVVGIVPGFARDKAIYLQNNRIKKMTVIFDVGKDQAEEVYELEDDYNMHFLDLKGYKFKKITFRIDEIFEGSKYDDTCIAEIDFWSDYVKNQDKEAAMNYYKKYKEDFALRPNDIVDGIWISDMSSDNCYNPGKSLNGTMRESWENEEEISRLTFDYPNSNTLYFTGVVNDYGQKSDKIDVRFYYTITPRGGATYEWELQKTIKNTEVLESCDGELYVFAEFPISLPGTYKVQFSRNGKLIGSKEFGLVQ